MSKIPESQLREAVAEILRDAKARKLRFVETIELQIGLKNYDPSKDKRFTGSIKLPHPTKKSFKVCLLADAAHKDIAKV